jgi:hypothetical protein
MSLGPESSKNSCLKEDPAKEIKRDMLHSADFASLSSLLRYRNAHIAAKKPSLMR